MAVRRFTAAVALEGGAGARFEAARSRLLLGERLLGTADRRDALVPLQEAFATFDRVGAALADRAADALAGLRARPGTGGGGAARSPPPRNARSPPRRRGSRTRRSPRSQFLERQDGGVSTSHTYRKLGVRNRTALARLFAG
ncbi:MAG: hypothetical protein U0237_15265 [Thermoleophilia bacterium]